MSVTFRKATLSDAEAIADFQMRMARETEHIVLDPEICRAGVKAVFQQPGLGMYFVASDDLRVVGSLLITYEWSDWRNRMVWWIQSVYVLPEYRRQGA